MTAPIASRPQIGVALRALRQLVADPEDTPRVFEIIRALGGPSLARGLRRFRGTALGRRVLAEEVDLIDALRDQRALAAMPAGTLGRAYYDFIRRESLSAEELAAASEDHAQTYADGAAGDFKRYVERMRDQHDLWHVVTQYGRDTLGETCLLAFTYAQTGNRGVGIIALVGAWNTRREFGKGVFGAVWAAYRAGRHASWLPEQDWEALLPLPLADVRRQLAIPPPTAYRQVLAAASAPPSA